MARKPKYRRQGGDAGDRAFVELGGVRIYLGEHGSPASRELYDRKLAEWESSGGHLPAPRDDLTVTELVARYWSHVEGFYVKAGAPTGEQSWIKYALKALCGLYETLPAGEFSPIKLKTVRSTMIEAGLARTTINSRISKIKRMFAWATENELVSPSVYQGLRAVAGLKANRSAAKEPAPVQPVPVGDLEAVLPLVPAAVAAMMRLQLLCGCRPGEIRILRMCDLDMTVNPWEYVPSRHKTEHHNRRRVIMFGTRCQEILQPYLTADAKRFLFRPLKPKGGEKPHPCYDKDTYVHAIARACKRAGVPHFAPNRLRHNAATAFRRDFGLESTQSALGHSRAETSEIYAQTGLERAREIARRVG